MMITINGIVIYITEGGTPLFFPKGKKKGTVCTLVPYEPFFVRTGGIVPDEWYNYRHVYCLIWNLLKPGIRFIGDDNLLQEKTFPLASVRATRMELFGGPV
jgi:hypothetical protein